MPLHYPQQHIIPNPFLGLLPIATFILLIAVIITIKHSPKQLLHSHCLEALFAVDRG